MAVVDVQEYLKLLPVVQQAPQGSLWSSYDAEADVLYMNFKKPSVDGRRVLVEGIPAEVCERCGEATFSCEFS
ncbi:MAG: YgiT-type zinc finger protein [Candidatus Binatia bacterium]